MKNLTNSFPQKDIQQLKRIERDFYKNLCDYAVETLKLLTISKDELGKRMKFIDLGPANQYAANNQSAIMLASHQFNWEWLVAAGNFSLPLAVDYVYQPQNSAFFNKYSQLCRTRFGAYPIKRDEVARVNVKRKDLLRALAIVADQYPGHHKDKRYPIRFLDQDSVFFSAANQLAIMFQYPVCFAHIKKVKRGYYTVELKSIAEPPYAKDSNVVIENYVRAVEQLIYEQPSGWLWSHNRWKTRHLTNH